MNAPIALTNYDTVASLIQSFAQDIAAIADDLASGTATSAETMAAVDTRVDTIATIFKGESPVFAPAPWNAEGQLAGKIVGRSTGIRADQDPIKTFFTRLAIKVMNAVRAVNDGMADEDAGQRIRADLREAVDRLTGVNP